MYDGDHTFPLPSDDKLRRSYDDTPLRPESDLDARAWHHLYDDVSVMMEVPY